MATKSGRSDGIWVGIDLGTSNCACAIWDSARGRAKWIRLPRHLLATPDAKNLKDGRTVPSAVMLVQNSIDKDDHGHMNKTNVEDDVDSIISEHNDNNNSSLGALVGEAAIVQRNEFQGKEDEKGTNNSTGASPTLVRSVKRLLGTRFDDLSPDLVRSLPLELIQEDDEDDGFVRVPDENSNKRDEDNLDKFVRVRVVPLQDPPIPGKVSDGAVSSLSLSPVRVLALQLRSIRLAAQDYLKQPKVRKKAMVVPGGSNAKSGKNIEVQNVVVGVPAHFSSTQRQMIQSACRLAGFRGHVSTLMESTAAAMAYGLSFNTPDNGDGNKTESNRQTILVVDMGGGTTDVTIATKGIHSAENNKHSGHDTPSSPSGYRVIVTEGDERLGGDDIDQALLDYVLEQTRRTKMKSPRVLSLSNRRSLLRSCRIAKEQLCDDETLPPQVVIEFQGQELVITQDDFQVIINPWIERARTLLQRAVQRFQETPDDGEKEEDGDGFGLVKKEKRISEIVLVGGTTRVPAVRRMFKDLFPQVDLCTSLDPMGSVAQGLAIHAAFLSNDVPAHLLKSALMLDSLPFAIGVQVGGNDGIDDRTFIPILKRNARLPAFGSATFVLADKQQAGVTIRAVEQIGEEQVTEQANHDGNPRMRPILEPMAKEDFTFLLKRLADEIIQKLPERTIEVGMKVDTDGKFVVSIFDGNDPEQVRKKQRFQELKDTKDKDTVGELGYIADLVMAEAEFTTEQWLLLAATIGMIIFYVAIKIAFAETPSEGARIL